MAQLPRRCPICGQDTIVGHGRRRKQTHDERHDWIWVRRGRCPECKKTFTVLPTWLAPYGHYNYYCRQQAWDGTMEGKPELHCWDPTRLPDNSTTQRWAWRKFVSLWTRITGPFRAAADFFGAPTILAWDLGRDNSYPSYCVKKYPSRFAAIGLLVGHRLYSPDDRENPSRLERLIKEDGLIGLRLSPIYNRDVVWLNDPVCYPLWKKAEQLGVTFNIFLAPHQVGQVADMAARFPGVNVVIDHIAMIDITAPDSAGFGPLLDLAKFPNVYVRTSLHNPSKTKQMPYRDVWPFLRRLYDRFGPRRMVWANFFEYVIMKELIPFFTAEDKQWILGRTAHRLYGFVKAG